MTGPFVDRITRTRTGKGKMVSGRMVETRSQKSSEEQKTMLEVEVHPEQAMHENEEMHGPDGRGNRRLASESTPIEGDSSNRRNASPGKVHVGQGGNSRGDSD